MAGVLELHGKSGGGVSGTLDITSRRYEAPLSMLLPNGPAWPRDDATLKTLVRALTRELSRVATRSDKLGRELDPATTFECLEDWEASYGLPDCAQPETLAARRAAIAAKLLAQTGHDQSLGFWTELFETLGYTLDNVIKGFPPMTCNDDCLDQVFDSSWLFLWQFVTNSGADDALLACIVNHNAWIGTYPVIHYPWSAVVLMIPALYGIACTANGYMAAVGSGGTIIYTDASLSWNFGAAAAGLNAICAVGETLVAVGAAVLDAIYSVDGGATWLNATPFVLPVPLLAISRGPEDDEVVVAVGEDGWLTRSVDAGANWTNLVSGTIDSLRGITSCTGAMVAVGNFGAMVRSVDNGATWAVVSAGITESLLAVSAWESTVVAVGNEVWRSDDSGASWTLVYLPTGTLRGVTSSPAGRWTACGAGGLIVQSLDDGVTWTEQVSPTTDELFCACAYRPSGRAILAGDVLVLE